VTLPRVGELDRVAEDVDEDLTEALLVHAHPPGQLAVGFVAELDAFVARLQTEHVSELIDELRQADFLRFDAQLAGLDLGDVEQAIEQRDHVLAAAPDDLHGLTPRRGHLRVVLHDLRIAEDAVQRRAQLMAVM